VAELVGGGLSAVEKKIRRMQMMIDGGVFIRT
jgi:hypothetical protein